MFELEGGGWIDDWKIFKFYPTYLGGLFRDRERRRYDS